MSRAYYNEIDPYAAAWLRNLIAAGHIAPGDVDERSILDVRPEDLRGYAQCHFFAGIGVWSLALRNAGWPDERPVWTGSCPCQPFSAAGKGGGFNDERHLWPAFHWLIDQCRPPVVVGEQVASKDGLAWLDLVQADLEGSAYTSGAIDLCAAGVGAPHIRQRLWWVGVADAGRSPRERWSDASGRASPDAGKRIESTGDDQPCGRADGLDHHHYQGLEGQRRGPRAAVGRQGAIRSASTPGESCGVAHADRREPQQPAGEWAGSREAVGRGAHRQPDGRGELAEGQSAAGPTNGGWRAADWLFCRDGKWRPVEPGTFPLAHGAPARVGRLRAYGNAIVEAAAREFVEAVMWSTGSDLA